MAKFLAKVSQLRSWLSGTHSVCLPLGEGLELYLDKFLKEDLLLEDLVMLKPEQIPASLGLLAGDKVRPPCLTLQVKLRRGLQGLDGQKELKKELTKRKALKQSVEPDLLQTLTTVAKGNLGMVLLRVKESEQGSPKFPF